MLTHSQKLVFAVIYCLSAIGIFFFVSSTLKNDPIKVSQKEEEKQVVHVSNLTVTFTVKQKEGDQKFTHEIAADKTLFDLMDTLRSENKVKFEIVRYTDHISLIEVNGLPTPFGYRWVVLDTNIDVTNMIDTLKISELKQPQLTLIQI